MSQQVVFEHCIQMLETSADDLRVCANNFREAARGHARYEALRLLSAARYAVLCERNINGENFDKMVDELRKSNEKETCT